MRFTHALALIAVIVVMMAASSDAFIFPAATYVTMFKNFITRARRTFSAANFAKKLEVFKRNVDTITNLNKGTKGVKFGVNSLADLTPEEFSKLRGLVIPSDFNPNAPERSGASFIEGATEAEAENVPPPAAYDWTNKGGKNYLQRPLTQDSCGSCWAFTAIATLEAQLAIKLNKNVKLSEQASLSCSDGGTCSGGWYYNVYKTLKNGKTKMVTAAKFPYKNQQTKIICDAVKKDTEIAAKVVDYGKIKNSDNDVQIALVNHGPLAVAIDATKIQFYQEGILPHANCSGRVDHAVTLVGYGGSGSGAFWKIRNSWGDWWGEDGHLRIARGSTNTCSVRSYVYYVTVAAN